VRAYIKTSDLITKPSYIKRIGSFSDYSDRKKLPSKINQIASVAKGFCEEPNASYHVMSFFRPIDLLEKFRPGYVPCVVSADFKYRDDALHAKFFFRSCDAYNLLPFDLSYCSGIAEQLLKEIKKAGFSRPLTLGDVSFWFSRIYISRFDVPKRKRMIAAMKDFKGVRIRWPGEDSEELAMP
jgi:Thymidylate synthase